MRGRAVDVEPTLAPSQFKLSLVGRFRQGGVCRPSFSLKRITKGNIPHDPQLGACCREGPWDGVLMPTGAPRAPRARAHASSCDHATGGAARRPLHCFAHRTKPPAPPRPARREPLAHRALSVLPPLAATPCLRSTFASAPMSSPWFAVTHGGSSLPVPRPDSHHLLCLHDSTLGRRQPALELFACTRTLSTSPSYQFGTRADFCLKSPCSWVHDAHYVNIRTETSQTGRRARPGDDAWATD